MAKGSTYTVTVELTEMELALLYHAVTHDPGEYRTVFWREAEARQPERHFVSRQWLEQKVFGQIAQVQPGWLPVIEAAQRRLTPHGR